MFDARSLLTAKETAGILGLSVSSLHGREFRKHLLGGVVCCYLRSFLIKA